MENILEKWTKCLNDCGCCINNEEWHINTLTDEIIRILPNPYKGITSKILSIALSNETVKFEPDEEKLLRDNGFEELFQSQEPVTASNNCDSDIFKDALEKVIAKIGNSKISPKEIDKLAQESLSVDDCKIFEKSSFYEEEFPSVVRSADYPEFAKDESGQARKKDDIIDLAKKKYGKAVVYHYSNLLRMIGSTIRMQQATHAQSAN